MIFGIGQGFAEVQILKKVKLALSLELWRILWWNFAYTLILTKSSPRDCEMTLFTGRGFAELQILKKDNGAISWTVWNIVMKFCIHIDIVKMYPMRLSNDTWDWLSFCWGSNSEKSETIANWHLSSVEALPSAKFWNCENGLISWTE